jgi:hypothetical protein
LIIDIPRSVFSGLADDILGSVVSGLADHISGSVVSGLADDISGSVDSVLADDISGSVVSGLADDISGSVVSGLADDISGSVDSGLADDISLSVVGVDVVVVVVVGCLVVDCGILVTSHCIRPPGVLQRSSCKSLISRTLLSPTTEQLALSSLLPLILRHDVTFSPYTNTFCKVGEDGALTQELRKSSPVSLALKVILTLEST